MIGERKSLESDSTMGLNTRHPVSKEQYVPRGGKRKQSVSNEIPQGSDKDENHVSILETNEGEEKSEPVSTNEPVKRKRGRRKLLHNEEERKIRRKMQCKLNQRRYRARQRGVITTLAIGSEKMTDHLLELETYHRFLVEFDSCDVDMWNNERPLLVTKHFFQVFRHGFALHSVEVSDIQEQFLRFTMDSSLISQGSNENGIDALMLQLKRYTSYHAVYEMKMESFRIIHSPNHVENVDRSASSWIIRVSGTLVLRISRDTVILLYPHIVENEDLHNRIVGHEITPGFTMNFYFNASCRVTKLEWNVDFASAFMVLLNNARQTAELLQQAIISPFSELGIEPHGSSSPATSKNKQLCLKFILL